MTKKEVLNNQVDEIMDSFDFRKVESVMKYLNWTWKDNKTSPDENEIRRTARKLMRYAVEQNESTSTGGFIVKLLSGIEDGKNWVKIDLAFAIDETMHDGEYYDKE